MKKAVLAALAASVLFAGVLATRALATKAKNAPVSITIKECQAKQPPVVYPHKQHVDLKIACKTCHHKQPDLTATSDVEVKPCTSCHLNPEKATTPSCKEMSSTKNPFHIRCVGCHKTEKKGPTVCSGCHKKA